MGRSPTDDAEPKPEGDLAEVERALSVLKGRTPEYERARREDEAAIVKRRKALDAAALAEKRRVRGRRALIGAVALVVGGFAVWAGMVFRAEVARRGRIEQAGDAYRAMGFVVVETSGRGAPGRLEATPDQGCMVVVATEPAPIRITLPSQSIEGEGPVTFCTCAPVTLTATAEVGATGGLALLRIDAVAIGGSRAFAFLPFEPGTTAVSDPACSEASLDAWIDDKRYPPQPPADDAWQKANPDRATHLRRLGLEAFAKIPADRPFTIASLPKESCVLALGAPDDTLAIRQKGGATPIVDAKGSFVWCAANESTVIVDRLGQGEVILLAAPAAKLGGTVGLGEALAVAGVSVEPRAIGMPPADRAWNAKQLLVASAVPEGMVTMASAPQIATDREARLSAVSFGSPSALVVEPAAEVFSFCEPALAPGSSDALCVFSGPHAWKIAGARAVGGVARSKLPFWLFAVEGVGEPAAMKAAAELVTFARRMRREGFEPTTIEAMTELPTGVEVLGRSGEDAIIALGVAPTAPWVFPYSDGPAWSITAGEPRIIPLAPLSKVKIAATSRALPSKDTRRSVVFRRQVAR